MKKKAWNMKTHITQLLTYKGKPKILTQKGSVFNELMEICEEQYGWLLEKYVTQLQKKYTHARARTHAHTYLLRSHDGHQT